MNRTIKFAASKVHNIDESEKNAYLSNELTIHNYNRPLDKHQLRIINGIYSCFYIVFQCGLEYIKFKDKLIFFYYGVVTFQHV